MFILNVIVEVDGNLSTCLGMSSTFSIVGSM